jgi:hypothetical protein
MSIVVLYIAHYSIEVMACVRDSERFVGANSLAINEDAYAGRDMSDLFKKE